MSPIYIGLMSGTSIDSIDVAAVSFDDSFSLLGGLSIPFPLSIQESLHTICQPGEDEINQLGQLDRQLGFLFADACNDLLKKLGLASHDIVAIGSHGQTIRHHPNKAYPFTLQIGDPNIIAERTGITTVADFRRRDMACGGQGAPLTPAFHHFAFHSLQRNRVVINIGGIANLTYLPFDENEQVVGFDCGPGNTLLDQWIRKHQHQPYDYEGGWANQGIVHLPLLERLLSDPYFQLPPPKSTGREYFNLEWLEENLLNMHLAPVDIQSTLAELTARTILAAVATHTKEASDILICGGGVHNKDLVARLERMRGIHSLFSTNDFGVDPDWVEAIAFAWMAKQTMNRLPGNMPAVTGAAKATILGGVYWPF
ncbi:MAG: anhydro-N-acetylmuramic acid kinase [Gammaproteobacteria bacterium]|nr:anhydro-N-acetylmuramic acid kinase [Gammaproteobacteria bacterium]